MNQYNEVKAAIIKNARRKIMHAFNIAHIQGENSTALSGQMLCGLFPEMDGDYLRSDVFYFVKKGFLVRVNIRPNQSFFHMEFELTGLGKEQADEINRDPALDP